MTLAAGWAGSWQAAQDNAEQAYPVCISFQVPASQKEGFSERGHFQSEGAHLGPFRPW